MFQTNVNEMLKFNRYMKLETHQGIPTNFSPCEILLGLII